MLASAVKRDLVARNVADLLDERPKRDDHEAEFWTAEQLERFLKATEEPRQWVDRWGRDQHQDRRQWPIWVIIAMTGMRRGEIAGLRWTDVDLEAARLTIRRSRVSVDYKVIEELPKSRKGRGAAKIRTIDVGPRTVDAFRRWARQQAEECRAAGEGWTETGFVFTREDGLPLHPGSISQAFERTRDSVMKELRLPRIPFHGLRHSAASTLLEQGVHLKVVAERLGHSSTQITSTIYSHVAPRLHSEAALLAETAVFSRPDNESANGDGPSYGKLMASGPRMAPRHDERPSEKGLSHLHFCFG
jgi:integrase